MDPRPLQHLREELARQHREGEDFADAWPRAIAAALRSLPRSLAREWLDVLTEEQMTEEWHRAFERHGQSARWAAALQESAAHDLSAVLGGVW